MSPQTHDWEVIRKHIKDAENTLIREILDDIKRKYNGYLEYRIMVEKWEKRLKE